MQRPTAPDADHWLDDARGPRLRYRDEGRGPAVLLVHGWLLDLTMFDALAATLATRFRVLRWDRRGSGGSAGTPGLAGDVDDALRLLRHAGVGRCGVLGMSQGARVALGLVAAARPHVACLVLDGAPAVDGLPGDWQVETPLDEYRRLLAARGIDALRAELAGHPLFRLQVRDADVQARLERALARYRGVDLTTPPEPPPQAVPPGELDLPVLVLNGEADTPQRLRIGAALARCIPHAEHRRLRGAGHLACWDRPDAYASCVHAFLETHLTRRAEAPEAP